VTATASQPVFYYDLGNPACYVIAETIIAGLPVVPEWEPVLGSSIGIDAPGVDRAGIERLAAEHGLLPVRWPSVWPPDSRLASLAATYAKQIGRAVAFSLACFRQAFAGGRDLGDDDTVLIAAAACEMHPTAVLRGIELRSVAEALERANARARRAAPTTLPAVQVGDRVFEGAEAVTAAARALA
jgi:2-hydroxychromene-2-carboxylate isomerase